MKRRPAFITAIVVIVVSAGSLTSMPPTVRTVDFIKILALGAGIGILLAQIIPARKE